MVWIYKKGYDLLKLKRLIIWSHSNENEAIFFLVKVFEMLTLEEIKYKSSVRLNELAYKYFNEEFMRKFWKPSPKREEEAIKNYFYKWMSTQK